ncbi:hypothetical protein N431DRAFT_449208 [Stipitochalara longipes BDJ]|nr:hypothetical protein N431DRAFT_449208 [Stipitochalara longipes BDJ]
MEKIGESVGAKMESKTGQACSKTTVPSAVTHPLAVNGQISKSETPALKPSSATKEESGRKPSEDWAEVHKSYVYGIARNIWSFEPSSGSHLGGRHVMRLLLLDSQQQAVRATVDRKPGEGFEDVEAFHMGSSLIYDGFPMIGQLEDRHQGVNVRNSCGKAAKESSVTGLMPQSNESPANSCTRDRSDGERPLQCKTVVKSDYHEVSSDRKRRKAGVDTRRECGSGTMVTPRLDDVETAASRREDEDDGRTTAETVPPGIQ